MSKSDTPDKSYRVRIAATPDGGDRAPDLIIREAIERYLTKLTATKAESTVSDYDYRLRQFRQWCEQKEGINSIKDITAWNLEQYEAHRREQGNAPITLENHLGTVKLFLEYCADAGLIDEALPRKLNPPKAPKDARADETMLRSENAQRLLEHYRESPSERASRGHALLEVAWYTGGRLGDLRGLDLTNYDTNDQYVHFVHKRGSTPLKNGQDGERIVGLPSEVCAVLDEYIAMNRHRVVDENGREPLFASEVGRPVQNTVRAWMYLATVPCHHSACPHGKDPDTCEYLDFTEASKCPSSRSPHQVRTGSITWQLNRGVPIDAVSERVNASARVIENHYDKPDPHKEMEKRRRQHLGQLGFDGDDTGGDAE